MKINSKKKGFALIVTLFLVIVLTLTAAGNLLSMERHQRSVQRTIDRVKLAWAADAVIDRTFKLFNDYARANGFPPQAEDAAGDWIVYDQTGSLVDAANDPFQKKLKSWFAAPFQSPSIGAAIRFEGLQDLKLDQVIVRADPATKDELYKRLYEIKVRVSRPEAGMTSEYSQKIEVATGKLFDYSVFFNTELEITPGLDWELQGPIFSNENIFLMNGKGRTLTLSTPGDVNSREYFAMKSAGNIYFYFKTTLAPNYLLENPYYRDAAQEDIYRTDLPTHPLYSAEFSSEASFKGVEVYGSPYLLTTLGFASAPPLLYTFSNGLEYGGVGSHTIKVKQVTAAGTQYYDFVSPLKTSPPMFFTDHRLRNAPYLAYAKPYAPSSTVSISTALEPTDPSKIRKLGKEWTPANPVSDPPRVNPNWTGLSGGSGGLLIADRNQGVSRRALPVGDSRLGTHVLIEPLEAGESVLVSKYKFETYANIRFTCASNGAGSCNEGSYQLRIKNPTDGSWKIIELPSGDIAGWTSSGLQFRDFYDYRVGGVVRILDIDVQQFLQSISSEEGVAFSEDFRPSIYVRTESPASWTAGKWAPVAVRIRNGAKLPATGLSIVTNGRLWVLGDYNVMDPVRNVRCSLEDIKNSNASCTTPPADLYSDSFGMLSNTWNMSNESTGRNLINVSTGLVVDRTRVVAEDVILNAAVVTGFLQSQLLKATPTPWPGGTIEPASIDLCSTNPGSVPLQPINLAQCASDPTQIPCLYGGPTICYWSEGFLSADIERDPRGIWNLKPTGSYYLGLKAKNDAMVSSPQFNALLAANHPAVQTVSNINVTMTKYLGAASHVETSRVATPSALLDVSVHRMPHEYFDPVNPVPLPIIESRGVDTLSDSLLWDQRYYWEESLDRPFPSANYPGIYWRKLWKSVAPDLPVHYTCIKNAEIKNYYDQYESCATTPGGEVVPGSCTTLTRWNGLTETNARCRCDDATHVYTNPQATLLKPHETSVPGGVPKDFSEHPTTWAKPDGFIGSGICPEVTDNYFSTYPALYYAWRAYGALWETRYSGGLENVINLQEAWLDDRSTRVITDDVSRTLHFSGNIVALWNSKQLVQTNGTPAFYGTSYYIAPTRDYDFNESLKSHPPPLPESSGMSLFSISRRDFREEPVSESV